MPDSIIDILSSLLFPHTCAACGTNQLTAENGICTACLWAIPSTGFLEVPDNEIDKIFRGRIPVEHAAASTYFTRQSMVQSILHQLKYSYRKELGLQLGQWMGHQLSTCYWMKEIDCLLPMPLHPGRKAKRGYNQAELLCDGIHQQTGLAINNNLLERTTATRSQTTQHRAERWHNMKDVFQINSPSHLENMHTLLVDDVVTTGATLEAMGEKILAIPGTKLSILCFAYTLPH